MFYVEIGTRAVEKNEMYADADGEVRRKIKK